MISKCLFPVAGYGTRFLPVTKTIPKEMLPIVNKPLIQYAVKEAMNAGIKDMVMVSNKHKNSIKDYFKSCDDLKKNIKNKAKKSPLDELDYIINNCHFHYVMQQQMLGLGHAIYTGKLFIEKESFAVILPDDLCINNSNSVLLQMIKLHKKYPNYCIVAIEEVPTQDIDKYGIIDGKLIDGSNNIYKVDNMIEKPSIEQAPTNLAIIGRYILTNEIFSVLATTKPDKNQEIQITNALIKLALKNKVIAYKFKGKRYDCGNANGFVAANNDLYKNYNTL